VGVFTKRTTIITIQSKKHDGLARNAHARSRAK